MARLPTLYHRPESLDLARSHQGGARVFFVGAYWWGEVSRPVSRRFGGQGVKQHARWTFVLVPTFHEGTIVEAHVVNWWMRRRALRVEALRTGREVLESQDYKIIELPCEVIRSLF